MTAHDDQYNATEPFEAIIRELLMESMTPLTVVKGMADQLLADTAALSEEQQEQLRYIHVNAARLAHLWQKNMLQYTALVEARWNQRT